MGETDRRRLPGALKSFLSHSQDHTRFVFSQILHPPGLSPLHAISSGLPDTHVLLSFDSESEPPAPSLSSQTQTHPFALVFHLLCDPDVLNPYHPTRFCKEAEIWAADISVFPQSHQGLAHWPVDKYFPN